MRRVPIVDDGPHICSAMQAELDCRERSAAITDDITIGSRALDKLISGRTVIGVFQVANPRLRGDPGIS